MGACNDLITHLRLINKIDSSEEYERVVKKLKALNEILPTGPKNFMDINNEKLELEIFACEHYPILLQEIIEKAQDDGGEIFEQVLKLASITENFEFIIETLNILTSEILMDNNTSFVVYLIEKLMLCDENYLLFSFIKLSHEKHSENMRIKQYIQQIISLPEKIANRMKANFPNALKSDIYPAILLINVLKSIHIMLKINEVEKTDIFNFTSFTSKLMSKVFGNFKTSPAIKYAIKILSFQAVQTAYHQKAVCDIMKCLQRNAIETVAIEALKSCKKKCLLKMLSKVMENSTEWKFLLTKKIPLSMYFQNDLLIENLVFLIAQEDIKLMKELLMEMLMIWSTKAHIFNTSFEQHFYVTKFIVLIVNYLPNLKENGAEIRKHLFNGVQLHFNSSNEKLRALGMITAETVIGILHSNEKEENELKFEYDSFNAKIQREIIEVIQKFPLKKFEEKHNEINCNDEITNAMEKLISISKNKSDEKIPIKKIIPPQLPPPSQPRKVSQLPQQQLDSDDDDLQPYPDSDINLHDKKRPRYILDIIKAFTVKEEFEDAEKFRATLINARDLIKQQLAQNHSDMAIDLVRIFIDLNEEYYVENFEELKTSAVIEVCYIYPKECAQYIAEEFHTETNKYSLKSRIFMLDVLSETAKRLSKLEMAATHENENVVDNRGGMNKLTLKLQDELNNRNKRDARKIIRERLLAKTRRIATYTKLPNEGINQFSSVAGWFFFPLVKGFGKKQLTFTKGTSLKNEFDTILLNKFLHTISIFMLCAENSITATKMAKEIVNLSVFLRYHEEAQIRLTVLHLFATIILVIPKNILVSEFNAELNEFINHLDMIAKSTVINYEPDKDCREFAKTLLEMCFNTLYAIQ